MKNLLYLLPRPNFWLSNYPVCREWDRVLNRLIDNFEVKVINEYYADIGGVEVWIRNYPYGYGAPEDLKCLPLRATRKRLYDRIGHTKDDRCKKFSLRIEKEIFND